jgi:hypothetical protein
MSYIPLIMVALGPLTKCTIRCTIRYTIRSFSFGLVVFIAHDIKLVVYGGDRPVRDIKPVVYGGASTIPRLKTLLRTLLLMVPAHHSWYNIIEFAGTVLVKQIPAPCRTYQSCQRCALPGLCTQSWIQCHPRCRSCRWTGHPGVSTVSSPVHH